MDVIHNFGDATRAVLLQDKLDAALKHVAELEELVKLERRRAINAEDRLIRIHREAQRQTQRVG